jgi:PAP2 superfamily
MAWVLAVVIPILVSIGRMYVGVHFPQDVFVGEAIGWARLVAYTTYEPRVGAWFTACVSLAIKLALAIAMPLALVIHEFVPSENPMTVKS